MARVGYKECEEAAAVLARELGKTMAPVGAAVPGSWRISYNNSGFELQEYVNSGGGIRPVISGTTKSVLLDRIECLVQGVRMARRVDSEKASK